MINRSDFFIYCPSSQRSAFSNGPPYQVPVLRFPPEKTDLLPEMLWSFSLRHWKIFGIPVSSFTAINLRIPNKLSNSQEELFCNIILWQFTTKQICILFWCDFDRASSLICGNKMPSRCNRGFYVMLTVNLGTSL